MRHHIVCEKYCGICIYLICHFDDDVRVYYYILPCLILFLNFCIMILNVPKNILFYYDVYKISVLFIIFQNRLFVLYNNLKAIAELWDATHDFS